LAKAAGASKVIVFEAMPERVNLARKIGADYVFNPMELKREGKFPSEKVMETTNGLGADMQVEAVGALTEALPEMENLCNLKSVLFQGQFWYCACQSPRRFPLDKQALRCLS